MLGINSSGAAVGRGNLRNNIAYTGTLTSNMNGTSASYNTWNLSLSLSDSQFRTLTVSLSAGGNTIRLDPATANGLPNLDYLDL